MFSFLRQNLWKYFLNYKHLKIIRIHNHSIQTYSINGTFLLSYISMLQHMIYGTINEQFKKPAAQRYWLNKTIQELINDADQLYEEEEYLEVYEILNRLQYNNNVEIQWRVCRVLYRMSTFENLPSGVKDNMILEAYGLICKTLEIDDKHSEVHKWMAILLDAKTAIDGTIARVRAAPKVKEHMLKCIELNPQDASVFYMLGYWCYEMARLTWMQRNIARIIFHEAPQSSFEEAYAYFMKVEELQPRRYYGNIYMLAKCCYEMGMYYRARYYFKIVADLPGVTEYQKAQAEDAKNLAEKLKEYDVSVKALQTEQFS